MFKRIIGVLFLFGLIAVFCGMLGVVAIYLYFSRDLPDFQSIRDYQPFLTTQVYASDGQPVGEFFEERRYLVSIDQIPLHVRQAFLAAEDASFYHHPGIDLISIARAMLKNLQMGSVKQGGSTITQQVVKNLLLSRERSLERKVKEAILAYRIETQLTKDEILSLYLNQIFLGNTAYGIQSAARSYYHKDVQELSIAEAAMLAGLPKAPSKYSPVSNYKAARGRQMYVINQMEQVGFIKKQQAAAAREEDVKVYRASKQPFSQAQYYISEVRRIMERDWGQYSLEVDGLQIQTALDLDAYNLAELAARRGLKEVDKRRGWRGPIDQGLDVKTFLTKYEPILYSADHSFNELVFPALVLEVDRKSETATVVLDSNLQEYIIPIKAAQWAGKSIDKEDRASWKKAIEQIKPSDVIEVSPIFKESEQDSTESTVALKNDSNLNNPLSFGLDQTPVLEAAVVLLDPHSGLVPAIIGGFDYRRSVFNRATQSLRQPGSAFKPIVYLAAIDGHGYAANTIVHDEPRTFRVGDEYWTPGNFDSKYMGPITLRVALEKSRNLVSAEITSNIGVDSVVKYARKLGLTTKVGRNLSLSLGSSEVIPLELTRAYGVFPAGGLLYESVFITQIKDRHGKIIFDYRHDLINRTKQVIPETSAFIMANLMKGVVTDGTGYRVKALGRPAAGKTGTSNDQMDAWFIGYTPEWVCGVWTGFDQKKAIGSKETGGVVSAPIWLYLMQPFLNQRDQKLLKLADQAARSESDAYGITYAKREELEPEDFTIPQGVEAAWVSKFSGRVAPAGGSGVVLEYFSDTQSLVEAESAETSGSDQPPVDYWDLVEG
jgi:penicillin-binding protein 1A